MDTPKDFQFTQNPGEEPRPEVLAQLQELYKEGGVEALEGKGLEDYQIIATILLATGSQEQELQTKVSPILEEAGWDDDRIQNTFKLFSKE
jgi:hypothetical protein